MAGESDVGPVLRPARGAMGVMTEVEQFTDQCSVCDYTVKTPKSTASLLCKSGIPLGHRATAEHEFHNFWSSSPDKMGLTAAIPDSRCMRKRRWSEW